MPTCLIGMGSNLGDRAHHIERAIARLRNERAIRVLAVSQLLESPPVGGPPGQANYLNAVAKLETQLEPHRLATLLWQTEVQLGRRPAERWAPRPIDLDLLLYGQSIIDTADLTVPHPRMVTRRFVLAPAAEIASEMVHPTTGWSIRALFDHLRTAARYVALTGPIGVGKSTLARHLVELGDAVAITEEVNDPRLEAFYHDPARSAWDTETQLLAERVDRLRGSSWSTRPSWTVSDFWYGQSLVFAKQWLPPEQFSEFKALWEVSRDVVVAPKLTVILDAPAELLARRIASRGRVYEQKLSVDFLEQLRIGFVEQSVQPGYGPMLLVDAVDQQQAIQQVAAALSAMTA